MVDRIGGARPWTPPEQEPELPQATDEDRNPTATLTKNQKKKKKKKGTGMARQNSSASYGAEPNGDAFHHAEPPLQSPTEMVPESPLEGGNHAVEEGDVIDVDPEGDVLIILSSQQRSAQDASRKGGSEGHHKACRIRVSSHHLRLASPVFKKKLADAGDHCPSSANRPTRVELTEPEKPMLRLLNMIHHRDLKILRSSGLEELCEVAALVNRYEMAESVGFVARTWVAHLKADRKSGSEGSELPAKFGEELLKWLFVAWAFCLPAEFNSLSRIAILHGSGRIDGEEVLGGTSLGFPSRVVDAVDSRRKRAVQSLLSAYEESMRKYSGDNGRESVADNTAETMCPHGSVKCDSMAYGLLFCSGKRGHLQPQSRDHSCDGLSFEGAKRELEEIEFFPCPEEAKMVTSPALVAAGVQTNGIAPQPKCTPGSAFRQAIQDVALANKIEGLDIRTLLPPEHQALYDMPGNNLL